MQSPTFGLDKNKELFRSFMVFEGMEQQSLAKTKSAKKIKSNHTRTQSFKSPSSTKFRGLQTIDQFLGIKKPSLKKPLKTKELVQELHQNSNFLSNQRFLVSSTVGSPTGVGLMGGSHSMSGLISGQDRSPLLNFSGIGTRQSATSKNRLKQVADAADLTSKIVKLSSIENDRDRFENSVLQLLYNYSESSLTIAKAELVTIIKYIFSFYSQRASQSAPAVPVAAMPKKRTVGIQSEPLDMEGYKHTAKRLIVNSDLKPPEDSFDNNMVLLFQKEILLDEILTILNEEDIDLNNLLSITLERIEANFYEPPADMSINDGVDLTLEDKMKMPTPKGKLADPSLMNRLMIDLTKIDLQESDSEQTKHQQHNRGQNKLANHSPDQNGHESDELQAKEHANQHQRGTGAANKKLGLAEREHAGQRSQASGNDEVVRGAAQSHQIADGLLKQQHGHAGSHAVVPGRIGGIQQSSQMAGILSQQKGAKSAGTSSQSQPSSGQQHIHHSELHMTNAQGLAGFEGSKMNRATQPQNTRGAQPGQRIDYTKPDRPMRSQLNSASREDQDILVQTPKEYNPTGQFAYSRAADPEEDPDDDYDNDCDELAMELELGELPDESQQSRGPAEEASFLSSGRRASQAYDEHPSKLALKESRAQANAAHLLKENQKKLKASVPTDVGIGGDLMSGGGGTTTGLDEPGKSLPKKGKLDKLFSRGSLEGAVVDKWSA